MKVSLKWLSEYVEVPSNLKAFCDRLDLTGTGVEAVETLGATFEHVVTAQVLAKEPHPDSDHMWVCTVEYLCHQFRFIPQPKTRCYRECNSASLSAMPKNVMWG